jgi:catechol 2,3-dioxygenase-like lactoylglutathione lyase family enzyme
MQEGTGVTEKSMAIDMRGLCPLIQVFDMPTSLHFYRDVLGFEIVQRSQDSDECGWCWLRCGGAELMLNTAYDDGERPAQPDRERVLGHMDAGLFIGCPDVDASYEYLKSKGVKVDAPKVAWYGMKQLYLKDPDGFGICFQWKA